MKTKTTGTNVLHFSILCIILTGRMPAQFTKPSSFLSILNFLSVILLNMSNSQNHLFLTLYNFIFFQKQHIDKKLYLHIQLQNHQAFQHAGWVDAVGRIHFILTVNCGERQQHLEMDQLLIFVAAICMVFH